MNDLNSPYYDRLKDYLSASGKESERGQVLVAASLIDEMLEEILVSYFVENAPFKTLFRSANAPLGSLSAKSDLALSLSLINECEHRDIFNIRKIRNRFAHSVLCSFQDQAVQDRSAQLRTGMTLLDDLPDGDNARVVDARQRFTMVAVSLVSSLYNRAIYVGRVKLQSRTWPD